EAECREMIEAAEQSGARLMIAYRLHFEKAHLRAVEVAQSGALGEVRIFESVFALPVAAGNIRTQADLGGGTLYDLGIYAINAARYIFQEEPIEVTAVTAARPGDERFGEVDEMAGAILKFPGERLAVFLS